LQYINIPINKNIFIIEYPEQINESVPILNCPILSPLPANWEICHTTQQIFPIKSNIENININIMYVSIMVSFFNLMHLYK